MGTVLSHNDLLDINDESDWRHTFPKLKGYIEDAGHTTILQTQRRCTKVDCTFRFTCRTAYGSTNYWWVTAGVYFWFASIGLFVGQHRYFAHRSYETNKFWETVLNVSGTLASLTSTFGYVIKHREHPKTDRRRQRSHSPIIGRMA